MYSLGFESDRMSQSDAKGVSFEMVGGEKGFATRPGDALRHHRADDQSADQPRPSRSRDPVDLAECDPSSSQRAPHKRAEMIEMSTRRNLGHDAAIGFVLVELRTNEVRQDLRTRPGLGNERRCGLVTTCLDAKNDHRLSNRRPADDLRPLIGR